MKVLSVVGARPQFVKAFPVSIAMSDDHEEILVHTGQHYDEELSDVFFDQLALPEPDYHLEVGSANHADQTAAMMTGIADLVDRETPDLILVYGDTNSTLAGALVAAKTEPLLAHVEAGLRSFNRDMPEEVNRILTDHCSDVLYAPTNDARENLAAEGIVDGVHQPGDVMYDAILMAKETALSTSSILDELDLSDEEYILVTIHRARNTDRPARLKRIIAALSSLSREVVFPVHPRTRTALKRNDLWQQTDAALTVIDPVGYLDFVRLLTGAYRVATDSGGVQKEAFFLDRPCVTLREETEWVELVDCGWNTLVGADPDAIIEALTGHKNLPPKPSLYGDGRAAARIISTFDEVDTETRVAAD